MAEGTHFEKSDMENAEDLLPTEPERKTIPDPFTTEGSNPVATLHSSPNSVADKGEESDVESAGSGSLDYATDESDTPVGSLSWRGTERGLARGGSSFFHSSSSPLGSLPQDDYHGNGLAARFVPGSVMAAYLADPVANPAARNLQFFSDESPRPRAADYVSVPSTTTTKTQSSSFLSSPLPCARTPFSNTSQFIAIVNDMEGMLLNERNCCVVGL